MKNPGLLPAMAALLLIAGCVKNKTQKPSTSGFPDEVAEIIDNRCATAGCHTTQSKDGASGLDLSSWENMLKGGKNGAVTIPFSHKQSSLFLFTNTYDDLGTKVPPSMPYNSTPLSRNEVILLRDWIDAGAPNKDGFIKFSDNPGRHKVYITNQGCDLVSVVDAESKLVMRYIEVGATPNPEVPHMVKVSPDGSFWLVTFTAGQVLQKFSTADEHLIGEVNIGVGSWNTVTISKDGTKAYCVDFSTSGKIAIVDLVNMQLLLTYSGDLFSPHGSALGPGERYLYVTAQLGNFMHKVDIRDLDNVEVTQVAMDGSGIPQTGSSLNIHEVIFSPDSTKYFITCQTTNEVRVLNTANDSLLAVIPVGGFPQEMAVATGSPYLFVSCSEDVTTTPGKRGSVSIIDYSQLTEIKRLYTGHQPHGLAIDETARLVYVANRNASTDGPAPHHLSDCGGRNGYFTLIDMNTLQLLNFKSEISVDPYSAAYR